MLAQRASVGLSARSIKTMIIITKTSSTSAAWIG